jgi:hypothetical protein
MKICYQKKNFSGTSIKVIEKANEIIEDYEAQGYDLTLRQLYYRFVSLGLIPNKDTEYKKLGSIINDARLAGMIDWDRITDRTRNLRSNAHWDSPRDIISACANQFRHDKWKDQNQYVEVWIEKDALVGILEQACRPLDVPHFSCRGYTSQSEMWAASQRLLEQIRAGKKVHIIHLGDHDPSGVDMSRDIEDRIKMFLEHHLVADFMKEYAKDHPCPKDDVDPYFDEASKLYSDSGRHAASRFNLNRIALNMDQVREYDPPPNPAKLTDSRSTSYVNEHGDESWELDALEPTVLTELIQNAVRELMDEDTWEKSVKAEKKDKTHLAKCAKKWDEVVKAIK